MLWCSEHREAWADCLCGDDTQTLIRPEDPPAVEYRAGVVQRHQSDLRVVGDKIIDFNPLPAVPASIPDFYRGGKCDVPCRACEIEKAYPPADLRQPGRIQPHTILDRSNTPADDVLPNDARARKAVPAGAVLDYFDSAWVEIAKALQDGNDQHNPGERLHWSRGKSSDHEHCIIRHYLQRGKLSVSPTGAVIRHSTYLAIRALMFLQEELETAGAPLSRGSVAAPEKAK